MPNGDDLAGVVAVVGDQALNGLVAFRSPRRRRLDDFFVTQAGHESGELFVRGDGPGAVRLPGLLVGGIARGRPTVLRPQRLAVNRQTAQAQEEDFLPKTRVVDHSPDAVEARGGHARRLSRRQAGHGDAEGQL